MKIATLMLFVIGTIRIGPGIAAPPANFATTSSLHALTTTTKGFTLSGDVAHCQLGNRLGVFVNYKEMGPASGALSPLQTGLPTMPPVRLGGFVLSVGVRVYLK